MDMLLRMTAAFVATLSFGVLFSIDRRQLIFCGITGCIAFTLAAWLKTVTTEAMAVLLCAFLITLFTRYLAVLRRSPVIVFLMPGTIPLAPGRDMYNTMYAFVSGDNAAFSTYGYSALAAAGAVAIGVALAFSLPEGLFNFKKDK